MSTRFSGVPTNICMITEFHHLELNKDEYLIMSIKMTKFLYPKKENKKGRNLNSVFQKSTKKKS